MFSLTAVPLRFVCEATTPVRLGVAEFQAGNFLRGAMGAVMRRAYCDLTPYPSPGSANQERGAAAAHAASCPVCWLLAADLRERPGQERRGYALRPPMEAPPSDCFAPGERFEFGLTLFGSALRLLPYFVLTVPEMGRMGAGAGRGRFALKSVWAENPLTAERECLLAEGESLVHAPRLVVGQDAVEGSGGVGRQAHAAPSGAQGSVGVRGSEEVRKRGSEEAAGGVRRVRVRFLTPMRLIVNDQLLKAPDFGGLFARLLKRLDELEEQFGGGGRRPLEAVQHLQGLADRVRLVEADTRWVEVRSGSSRTGQVTWLSGFVGSATYTAPQEVWQPLMPWLRWGQVAQVGKDTVKGNGVLAVEVGR